MDKAAAIMSKLKRFMGINPAFAHQESNLGHLGSLLKKPYPARSVKNSREIAMRTSMMNSLDRQVGVVTPKASKGVEEVRHLGRKNFPAFNTYK